MAPSQLIDSDLSTAGSRWKTSAFPAAISALLATAIAGYFWVDSRYPALVKKLHAGRAIHISGKLSFDELIPVTAQMPLLTRAGYTAVDWAWTNRIGMTFGVFFGAAMLTLLAYLPRRRFASAYANTALGALFGAQLGVCANCAAPVGQGLLGGGASPATMLGAIISSPTLNVVVLAMAFTLLPLPIALLRLAAPLVLLALVPLLVGSLPGKNELQLQAACTVALRPALGAVTKAYLKNLARLALATVPWMLLAGLLGALVVELIPVQTIPVQATFLGLIAVALLGTFAPMPIAFDVAMAYLLLSRGVAAPYVAALACTLGAFSIYPFLIVGRGLSWRVAVSIFAAVTTVGIAAGVVAIFV